MINEYNYEVLSREELERNFKLMKDNNIEVRETIILHNIKLVFYRYYKRFSNTNMNMEDIVAYGMIGLIKAVDTFRLDKKCTFTTYASKCIDNEILMYIRRESYRYVSLDELIGDDDLTLNDLIIDPSINIEGDYMDKEDFDYVALKTFNINDISMSNYDIDNSTIKKKNGDIYIKLIGKEEFEGYKCIGTINNLNCREKRACTTLKALTQGTTYVSGQYTYTYNGSTGWSVALTDKESTDPVTTELCETVNTKPIVSMKNMFSSSNATSLDLSSFDTSKVTDMSYMFCSSKATSLDLSSFDTSNVTNMSDMFSYSKATTGYARTEKDATKFNSSSSKPSGLTFVVK